MQLAWGPAIDRQDPDGDPHQYGNALLSRLPLLVSDVHPLPGDGEPRVALRTMIELDGAALWVTTTHLTTAPPEQRAAQVAAIAALHTDAMATGVVVGDLNARPDAPELAALREQFTDAWELAGEREDRARWQFWHRDAGLTHPARLPRKRIDQVWVTPGIRVASARVLDGAGASDHLPLVVDLLVPSGV
jgi:endonuclease/exonuclease/phosphatase family metal-dependent hydrolase